MEKLYVEDIAVTITIINILVSGVFSGGGVETLTTNQKISEVSGVKSQCLYTHRDYTAHPACAHVSVCVCVSLSVSLSLSGMKVCVCRLL